jgi:tRNA (adenine57-N1/adenine58-N1)-methyltransferase
MAFSLSEDFTKDGDLVQLVGLSHKSFILTLHSGAEFHTHRGLLKHDDLIGKQWGSQVFSHNGSPFFIVQPTLADVLKNTKSSLKLCIQRKLPIPCFIWGLVLEAG